MTHYTKGTLSPLKGAPTVCRRPVSETVSLPLSGCFSPFPHGTGSLSVSKEYLALEGGPPMFRQNFTCSALLDSEALFSHTGLSPAMAKLSRMFCYITQVHIVVLQPRHCRNNIGLGYSRFARRYSGNRYCFPFLEVLRCFNSLGFLYRPYIFRPE